MTCFWDGILKGLSNEDFNRVFNINKPNNRGLVKLLIDNNSKETKNITWNGDIFTNKQIEENYEHIKNFDINSIKKGYL